MSARILPDHVLRDIAHATKVQLHDPFQGILGRCGADRCGYRQPLSHVIRSIERSHQLGIEL